MFYHGTKYKFALSQGSPLDVSGSILCASSMPSYQMIRRTFRKEPHLQHRLFDPQLYLSTLSQYSATQTVTKLATWPWFCCEGVPTYSSSTGMSQSQWKQANQHLIAGTWQGKAPSTDAEIIKSCRTAIELQVDLGCKGIILPSPLLNMHADGFEIGTKWLDVGLAVAQQMKKALPIYATVALSDTVLRGFDPVKNDLLSSITSQIASRPGLTGIYLVVEQASEQGYVCTNENTLLSILILIDDLVRGSGKSVIVNYLGAFGIVASAIGASIWSSGYYVGQRRLKLADMDDKGGRAMPRYQSLSLAGDFGLELMSEAHSSGLLRKVLTKTPPSEALRKSIENNSFPRTAPEWAFTQSNTTAAAAHYNWVMRDVGLYGDSLSREEELSRVGRWLRSAESLAGELKQEGFDKDYYTELNHQGAWKTAFNNWCDYVQFTPDVE